MDQATDFSVTTSESLVAHRLLSLKNGDTFGVFDQSGDIRGGAAGLYHCDTRYLSEYELRVGGERLLLLSTTLRDDNATLTSDLTNPDLPDGPEKNLIHVRRSRFIWRGHCYERLLVRNFDLAPRRITLELGFGADFVDLFQVRGMVRGRHGRQERAEVGEDTVTLRYFGLDDMARTTRLRFAPSPSRLDEGRALFDLLLPPRGREMVHVEIGCEPPPSRHVPAESFLRSLLDQRRAVRRQSARSAAIITSNDSFNEAMQRAISDLTMLVTDTPYGAYPYAGVPWFSTPFGRDAVITALQVLWMDPGIARGVLRYLAANQATHIDPASDAEPGKILHEVRDGEMARLGEVPFRRYYGSVDSTPLFVMLAGAYLDRTGDLDTVRALWPNVEAALDWIDRYGDRDGDGFVEYHRQTPEGLANQGWKDSFDSISHADGRLAEGPIALVEVQAYVYAARIAAARIARLLGRPDIADRENGRAETLRVAFDRAFWCEELGTYALALDGDKAPCRVRASNAGQVLMTGIASPERARRVGASLLETRFFTGWGIRTLAASEARFNPMSYHNGSVWPHDNALIGIGLGRYGMRHEAIRLFEGLFAASLYIDLHRLPELLCGFARRRGQGPVFYPVACSPQAWAATALHALLGACLGLRFDPEGRAVVFDRPVLPPFLDEVRLLNVRLNDASISVVLRRLDDEVAMNVLAREGDIHAVLRS